MAPRVIVTRPAAQAAQWANALTAQGFDAHSFPLIEIADALQPAQRQALHARAAQADVCMWVSSNAVGYFFETNRPVTQVNPAQAAIELIVNKKLRHWATGPGTVAALLQHGVPLAQIDAPDTQAAQWDSAALWQRVAGQIQAGTQVLILRGTDVGTPSASRDDLAAQIRAAGGTVEFAVVYARRAPSFTAAQVAWARAAASDGSVWIFTSSQAVTHLPAIAAAAAAASAQGGDQSGGLGRQRGGHRGVWGLARCIATHDRIAQTARDAGFAVVCTSRPGIADVVQSLKSML
jgi:uroporphyrinogen-III synthase